MIVKKLFLLLLLTFLSKSCYKYDENNPVEVQEHLKPVPISENSILEIGDYHEGGIVFYIDDSGEHGLVCSLFNVGNYVWGCQGTEISGADGSNVGTGLQNTLDIIAECDTINAASACMNLSGEYDDWYLPSSGELYQMGINGVAIQETAYYYEGDDLGGYYWSSTEKDSNRAYICYFDSYTKYPNINYDVKSTYETGSSYHSVRAVRSF